MKKFLLTLILLSPFVFKAQSSLEIVYADTLVEGNVNSATDIAGHIWIRNTAKVGQNVLVRRVDSNYTDLTDSNAICWGTCFSPDESVALFSIPIGGEDTNKIDFISHVYPDEASNIGCGPITYIFYIEFDPTDNVRFTMNYCLTADFDLDEDKIVNKLSVFPNPAIGTTKVSYTLDSKGENFFELYNLLGKKVYEHGIEGSNGEFEFNAKDFSSGVYYYAFKSNGEVLETKKMVIQ